MCVCARDRESVFKCVSKWACQPCTSLAMAAFPETQLERSYGYTWLDTIVWNQRQEVERARLKLTLILQADKTAISCSLIATPHVPSLTHVIGRLPPAYGQMRCLLSSEHKGTRSYTHRHTQSHDAHAQKFPHCMNFKSRAHEHGSKYWHVCPGWLMSCITCCFANGNNTHTHTHRHVLTP